ncbi:hypothetical protein [Actinokineospora bangkokensis]|uniref:hypothetical protein n=1 Tax=Actinokineospora bangkokensis TaxID=1193682 RepID=UPI000ACB3CF7|nr:hypothetical protein [Actinokineospora bangkokensis]
MPPLQPNASDDYGLELQQIAEGGDYEQADSLGDLVLELAGVANWEVPPGARGLLLTAALEQVATVVRATALKHLRTEKHDRGNPSCLAAAACELLDLRGADLYEDQFAEALKLSTFADVWKKPGTTLGVQRRRRAVVWAEYGEQEFRSSLGRGPYRESFYHLGNALEQWKTDSGLVDKIIGTRGPQPIYTPQSDPPSSTARKPWRIGSLAAVAVVVAAAATLYGAGVFSGESAPSVRTTLIGTSQSTGGGIRVAYANQPRAASPSDIQRLATGELLDDIHNRDTLLKGQLDAGAFLVRDAEVSFEVTNVGEHEISVYAIHIDKKEVPIPVEQAILIDDLPLGGDKRLIEFDLDETAPEGYKRESGYSDPYPYFKDQTISIAPGATETFSLQFFLGLSAYEFTINIEYTDDGELRKANLNRSGQPFRITGEACPQQRNSPRLRDNQRNLVNTVHYARVAEIVLASGRVWQYQDNVAEYERHCMADE